MSNLITTVAAHPGASFGLGLFILLTLVVGGMVVEHVVIAWRRR